MDKTPLVDLFERTDFNNHTIKFLNGGNKVDVTLTL